MHYIVDDFKFDMIALKSYRLEINTISADEVRGIISRNDCRNYATNPWLAMHMAAVFAYTVDISNDPMQVVAGDHLIVASCPGGMFLTPENVSYLLVTVESKADPKNQEVSLDWFSNIAENDPSKAGSCASDKRTFGVGFRYVVAAVHTRFDACEWFVWDGFVVDPQTNLPKVIRQAPTLREALAGLL